ncbi:hypothetical protein BFF78_00730 [Streptomyces fodineus]|uniref:Uncharacterized protein n=1 Tax=Streptomyces fodineus TaxID=1904616 RepID=A0A1D7Y2J3_9ACTN|nr:hypothetical protein BFF78_00730 [Streptomyces fodineus]
MAEREGEITAEAEEIRGQIAQLTAVLDGLGRAAEEVRITRKWTQPAKSAERQALEEELRRLRSVGQQPSLPQRRLILALFAASLACFGAFLVFFLPSQSLVRDLRSTLRPHPRRRQQRSGDLPEPLRHDPSPPPTPHDPTNDQLTM